METRSFLEQRPKLRRDVQFVAGKDAVLFRSDKSVFTVKGASSYPFISRLVRLFDGNRTLSEICGGLDSSRMEHVVSLVRNLQDRGVISFVEPENDGLLPEQVRARFSRQIETIEHFSDGPLARFRSFRETRVLLTGDGLPVTSAALSLVRNGLEELHLTEGREGIDLNRVNKEIANLSTDGVESHFRSVPLPQGFEDYDVVAYCSTRPSLRVLMELNERCRRVGSVFLPGIVIGERSYLGPLVNRESSVCWFCAFLRIAANASPEHCVELWRALSGNQPPPSGAAGEYAPAAQMLGNNLAFELFKLRCGHLEVETRGGIVVQSLETLEAARVQLLMHPECPYCASPKTDSLSLEPADGSQSDPEALLRVWKPMLHPRLGVFQSVSGEEIRQVPFRCASATFARPQGGRPPVTVYGFDPVETAAALRSALVEAARRYSLTCPIRSHETETSYQQLKDRGSNPVAADQLVNWHRAALWGPDQPLSWVPAYSVEEGELRLVPAEAVRQPDGDLLFRRSGSAAGDSARSAFEAGLLNALAWERVTSLPATRSKLIRHRDADIAELDPDLKFVIATIQRFERGVRIFELKGDTPVRVVLALPGDSGEPGDIAPSANACALGVGASLAQAAKTALTYLGGAWQLALEPGDLGYGIVNVAPDFEMDWLDGVEFEAADSGTTGEVSPPLEEALRESGFDALFVDTTPPDIRSVGTLFSGVVLLRRTRGEPQSSFGASGK